MKRNRVLAALTIGALTYGAWLAYDIRHPVSADKLDSQVLPQVESPVELAKAELPASEPVKPIRPKAYRRSMASKTITSENKAATKELESPAPSDPEPNEKIPMPGRWSGQFEKRELALQERYCDMDRPCSPRGRDGVLLAGAVLSLRGLIPQFNQILTVGSYRERTPLLVYK